MKMEKLKQETLKEASKKYSEKASSIKILVDDKLDREVLCEVAFEAGAKWQAERIYSKEEMEATFHYGHQIGMNSILSTQSKNIPEPNLEILKSNWFEQFKKK